MAFKTVGGSRRYIKYSECSPGDMLVTNARYLGSEDGKYGIQHLFDEGETVCVLNSAGQLNYLVEKFLTPYQLCNIQYSGKIVLEKGAMAGKESHQFAMEVDDGRAADAEMPVAKPVIAQVVKPAAAPKVMKPVGAKPPTKKAAAAYVPVGDDIEL